MTAKDEAIKRLGIAVYKRVQNLAMLSSSAKLLVNRDDDEEILLSECQALSGWANEIYALTKEIHTLNMIINNAN